MTTACMNCQQLRETTRYKVALRKSFKDLCGPCHLSLSNLGLVLIADRRSDDLTPIRERRMPVWLTRLTTKELAS